MTDKEATPDMKYDMKLEKMTLEKWRAVIEERKALTEEIMYLSGDDAT